jgi:HAMP domain-containing protein
MTVRLLNNLSVRRKGEGAMKITEWEPKIKCTKSLIFKAAVLLTIGLFIVIGIFSHINVKLTEKRLFDIAANEASKTSDAIKGSIKDAMLKNNREVIDSIISTIGKEASIEDIKIIDIIGQVKYAKDNSEVGKTLDRTKIKSCNLCHKEKQPSRGNLTVVFKNHNSRILRNANPIDNETQCHTCHDPSQKVLGKLLVDFKIKDIDNVVKTNKTLLMASQAVTLITALFITVGVLVTYLKPKLHRLTKEVRHVARGNYDALIEVRGEDEIAVLSTEFNNMVEAIKQRDEKINSQLKTFTTLFDISSILKRAESLQEDITLILSALEVGLNIQQCTILFIDDIGKVELKGSVGLSKEDAELVRLVIEEMFELSIMPVSKERQEIKAVVGEKEKIMGDEVFVVAGNGKLIRDFIIAPLKAGGRVIGTITVHKIKGREINDPEIKDTLSIIATALSPYVYIGMCLDKKAVMMECPYDAIISDIQRNIEKVEQYQGGLSLIVVKAENYEDMVKEIGIKKVSEIIKESLITMTSSIDKVHEIIRISEDSIAVLLPMITKEEAAEIVQNAVSKCAGCMLWQIKSASYPEDSNTAEGVLHEAIGGF